MFVPLYWWNQAVIGAMAPVTQEIQSGKSNMSTMYINTLIFGLDKWVGFEMSDGSKAQSSITSLQH